MKKLFNYKALTFAAVAIALPALFFWLTPVPETKAAGTTYYVSPSGNNNNSGTSQNAALKTVNAGLNKMSAGDTLRILAGTYNQDSEGYFNQRDNWSATPVFEIPKSLSGTAANPTIIEGYGNGVAKLSGQTYRRAVMSVQASHIIIRNLTIDGTSPNHGENSTCLYIGQNGGQNSNITNVLVDNTVIEKCEGQGVEFRGAYISGAPRYVSGEVRNSTIRANSLYTLSNPNMGSGWQSGVKVAKYGRNILIENNDIIDNWGEGVAITRGENITFRRNNISNNFSVNVYLDNSINTTLENNLSYCLDKNDPNAILRGNNVATGMTVGEEYYGSDYGDDSGAPLWGNKLSGLTMINNISYGCSKTLAWYGTDRGSGGGLDNALIANNTFYTTTNTTSAVYFDGEAGDNVKVYNNIFVETGSGGTAYIDNPAGTYDFKNNYWNSQPSQAQFKGTGDIYGSLNNVKFAGSPSINPNSFKLLSGSSLIDKGIPVSSANIDYFCGNRTGTLDIGAHEFGSTGTCGTGGSSSSSSNSTPSSSTTTTTTSSSSSSTSTSSGQCLGDYDNNGQVGIGDFALFANNYKRSSISCNLDITGNNCYLNVQDFVIFAGNYKQANCPYRT